MKILCNTVKYYVNYERVNNDMYVNYIYTLFFNINY